MTVETHVAGRFKSVLFEDVGLHADEIVRETNFYRACLGSGLPPALATLVDDAWLDRVLQTPEYTFVCTPYGLVMTFTWRTWHPASGARETHRQHFFPVFATRSAKARLLAVK